MTNPLQQPTYQHILDDDVIDASENRKTSVTRDKRQAKLILQETSADTGQSLYDHLAALIKRILEDRPPNVIDYFEDFSRQVREEHFRLTENILQETFIEPERLQAARNILPILSLPPPDDFPGTIKSNEPNTEDEEEEYLDPFVTDVMHLQFYWSLAGYGFSNGQIFILSCCLRKLENNPIVDKCRFWGQIYGLQNNYFIAEVDLTLDEITNRIVVEEKEYKEKTSNIEKEFAEQMKITIDEELIPRQPAPPIHPSPLEEIKPSKRRDEAASLPQRPSQPQRDIPAENSGSGLNRKTYFVCNNLGDEWIELPKVTPQQIQASRKIRKYFTGDLKAEVYAWPIFPGMEKHYLRAIIARITAGTYVSPIGYYRIGAGDDEEEEEADEEENDNDKQTTQNPGYEPINGKELLALHSWMHYRPNILKQGRINWFNPKDLEIKDEESGEQEEVEDEEEEDDGKKDEEPEMGPNILTPCSEDMANERADQWTTKFSQKYNPSNCMVIIRSNIWPGAFSFSVQRVHDSLYVGWGNKYVKRNYSSPTLPPIEDEYLIGPEVMEIMDPTIEDEEKWRLAHVKKEIVFDEAEEEVEPEAEEEEEF